MPLGYIFQIVVCVVKWVGWRDTILNIEINVKKDMFRFLLQRSFEPHGSLIQYVDKFQRFQLNTNKWQQKYWR